MDTGQVVQVVQVIQVIQVVQVVQAVQVVRVVRTISLDDMHSENIFFLWSKPSKYQVKLRCHACEGRRTDGKWKIGQCSGRPETAIITWNMKKIADKCEASILLRT